jgi:hypothetical protein
MNRRPGSTELIILKNQFLIDEILISDLVPAFPLFLYNELNILKTRLMF